MDWLTPVMRLVSNISIADDPHPTAAEINLMTPFHRSLALINRGLSANVEPVSPGELAWVQRQLGSVDRLIEQHSQQPITFNDLPYSPPDPAAAVSAVHSAGPAASHAASLSIPIPSPLSGPPPAVGGPLEHAEPNEVKSFYHRFVSLTLQQQLTQAHHHYQHQRPVSNPPPAGPSSPHTSRAPIPSDQPAVDRQATESPDPLAMNLATRSANRSRSSHHLADGAHSSCTPSRKKRRPNPPQSHTRKHSNHILTAPLTAQPQFIDSSASAKPSATPLSPSPIKPSSIPSISLQSQTRTNSVYLPPQSLNPSTPCQDPAEQFVALVEDILEADDMAVPAECFCQLRSQFVLSSPVLSRIKSFLEQSDGELIQALRLADLSRLIKILERGAKVVEDMMIIPPELRQKPASHRSLGGQTPSSKKPGSKKAQVTGSGVTGASSRNPTQGDVMGGDFTNVSPNECSDDEKTLTHVIEEGLKDLTMALHSIDATLTLLSYDKHLPKQLFSEELIQSIVKGAKDQLTTVIFPFIEADEKGNMDAYSQTLRRIIYTSKIVSGLIASSFSFFATSIVPKIDLLVRRTDLSESIIINVSFIAIAPFFVHSSPMTDASSSKAKSKKMSHSDGSMKAMRLECLKLLRNISSKYPDQRGWIVEEILNSILNLPEQSSRANKAVYHLANGKSIHIFSALLLHIVQCCLTGARTRVKVMLSASDPSAVDSSIATLEVNDGTASPPSTPQTRNGNSNFGPIKEFVESEILAATKLSKKIISFFLQKSGKSSKSTLEAHYKTVFDKLIEDLINVLFLPDWPVAEFMLGLFSKTMMGLLDSNKVSADTNAVKSMCLDHLGFVTAKLMEPVDQRFKQFPIKSIPSLSFKAIVKNLDRKSLSQLFQLQKIVLTSFYAERNSSDLSNTAADFVYAQWICEMIGTSNGLQASLDRSQADIDAGQEIGEEEENKFVQQKSFLAHLNSHIEELGSMYSIRAAPTVSQLGSMALGNEPIIEAISKIQGLKGLADLFIEKILATSASSSVAFRSKAIKAIALIVAKDEAVFFQESVKKGIENRMLDSSPAVRDAAVELVGKYVVDRPDLAVSFLPQISARVADKGVSVRRRVVKLLKAIYLILTEEQWIDLRVDISHRLISRIHDEEISIKDLAISTIDELWFGQTTSSRFDASSTGSILIKVTAAYKEVPSPLEALMKSIFKQHSKEGNEARQQFDRRCKDIIENLIDRLMDLASNARDQAFSEVECVKTICVLTLACPKLLDPNKALMLLPYLKGATTSSDHLMMQYLLKIFRGCVTLAPKALDTFGERLQSTLLVLVNKPTQLLNYGGAVLQESIACLCAVVIHQSRDYDKLLNVFKACEQRLRNEINQLDNATASSCPKSLHVLMYLVSTLVAYGQLDQLPDVPVYIQEAFKSISQTPMHIHAYNLLLKVYHAKAAEKIRSITLICLGILYRSFPPLMTRSDSINMMDNVFANNSGSDLQHRLLKLIAECISDQIDKAGGDEEQSDTKEVDVNQLIGNVDGFPDSGVVSAIVQRYLGHITTLAQSVKPHIQKVAVEIISFTIKQGLTHPLECVPVLVALESSGDAALAKQVFALHTLLHVQRGNLVHCRFLETMDKVFDCHSKASGTSSSACGPRLCLGYVLDRSVMSPWYTLLSEKRSWRTSFSQSLIKSFSIDPHTDRIDERTIAFQRYLAEALLTLELKTEEEVMLLIENLNRSVGQSAYQTLHLLGGDPLKALLDQTTACRENGKDDDSQVSFKLGFNSSIVLGIGFVLRDLLKELYMISDQKLSKYTDGMGKAKTKTPAKDKLTTRTCSVKELVERLDTEFKKKVPALDRSLDEAERCQKQLEAFGNLVKYDSEVLANAERLEMLEDCKSSPTDGTP